MGLQHCPLHTRAPEKYPYTTAFVITATITTIVFIVTVEILTTPYSPTRSIVNRSF